MRLKSLYIKEYKNIKEQTFDFSDNTGYIALIGLNGSGKSNLLEAISLIFDDLYDIQHTEQVNGYTITYEIEGVSYSYTTLDEHNNVIPLEKGEKVCPSSVIACYSGEDLRLWNMAYMPYYMGFFRAALRGKDYVPRTMYINKYCWKIALISLLFSLNRDVQQFVQDTLHFDVNNVSIQFAYNTIANPQQHDAYNWLEKVKQTYGTNDIPLKDLRDFGLNNLKHQELTEDQLIFYYLYFLFMPSKSRKQPVDKLITNISIKIGNYEFDALSEGEKKMILIECIMQILGDDNSLVLLDEPDAHVHIENKKILLEETIIQHQGQTIFTTHSPSICKYIPKGEPIYLCNNGGIQKLNNHFEAGLKILPDESLSYLLFNSKHLVITEGKTDCRYITKAISFFETDYPTLKNCTDFVSAGGTDADCVTALLNRIPDIDNRKIIVLVDRDGAGLNCARDLLGNKQLKKENLNEERPLNKPNTIVLMLPNNREDQEDFVIEDYFSNTTIRSLTIRKIIEDFTDDTTYNNFPKVKNDLKEKLLPNLVEHCTSAKSMEGFKILLTKLESILS